MAQVDVEVLKMEQIEERQGLQLKSSLSALRATQLLKWALILNICIINMLVHPLCTLQLSVSRHIWDRWEDITRDCFQRTWLDPNPTCLHLVL